tara:strand:+ start:10273 stop:10710 length:438 start_codon:yes stop_codon:yes gene_type:complete
MKVSLAEAVDLIGEFLKDIAEGSYEAPLSECSAELRQGFVEIFANQQSSVGERWEDHSDVTIALHGAHPLLILSGTLYDQLTGDSSGGDVSQRSVSVGTDLEYAPWNNDGTENIPAREFMYIPESAQEACVEHVADHIFNLMPGD